jgi:molybdopterin-containing oxidoreductase family iron-sulfur binding subunit
MDDMNEKLQTDDGHAPVDRRNFLKLAGFSFAGAVLAGCERTPVEKAIPYLIRPEEIVPGKATWYASTCSGCSAGCGILLKNRDGRPIKVEGNPDHPVSRGGLCVVGQSILLGLYDSHRLKEPRIDGVVSSWEAVDAYVAEKLRSVQEKRGKVRLLTGTVNSPTAQSLISSFLGQFNDGTHIQWDPQSYSAILDAHQATHGSRSLPKYKFDAADVVISFDADFLGTWVSPVEFTKGYASRRSLRDPTIFSRHFQFESRLSITGAKADERYGMTPDEVRWCLRQLDRMIEAGTDQIGVAADIHPGVRAAAASVFAAKGRSLVISGSNDIEEQMLINRINHRLANYERTVSLSRASYQHSSNDGGLSSLLEEAERGEIGALFIADANPVFDLPHGGHIADLLDKIPLVVSFAEREDETTAHANLVCAVPHAQESWMDAEPSEGVLAVAQPGISSLGKTRSFIENIAVWSGKEGDARTLIQDHWRRFVYSRRATGMSFIDFWNKTVHDGFVEMGYRSAHYAFREFDEPAVSLTRPERSLSLRLHSNTSMVHGRHAHNAWLHEVPDPITKISWDNCAVIAPATAARLGISSGDIVQLSTENDGNARSVVIPAWVQDGQPEEVVAVPLHYGRYGTDRFSSIGAAWLEKRETVREGMVVGTNAAPLILHQNNMMKYERGTISIKRTGDRIDLACSQPYGSLDTPQIGPGAVPDRRPLIQETTLDAFRQDPSSGSFKKHTSMSMWPEEHPYNGHHWGMVIDLNACTGCSGCVVSCQAENNIPVVGKDEVMRNREMHWMRLDRYIYEQEGRTQVAFQPMLCHQCDNAPCETVCPVEATVHSSEGLNQQVYNRCVGTRYCANNCPYKIRRFNWFDYPHDDQTENMILNPDVVVRSRGVMEKCSFCVQRIQEAKIEAKRTGNAVSDDAVKTACQQSCPADAIVFGDMNNENSGVAGGIADARHYRLLEELEVRPSVGYKSIVHNRPENQG